VAFADGVSDMAVANQNPPVLLVREIGIVDRHPE
jgi:hypothetical protein